MKRDLLFTFLLFAAAALVFGVSLPNPFYYDDLHILRNNGYLHGLTPPYGWFGSLFNDSERQFPGYRPVLMLSFLANARLLGDTPAAFRIVNLFLHVLNAALLVFLVRKLMKEAADRWIAWAAGFLFLLHPLQTLGVNFLWKRSSLLEATFLLVSMLLHVRERERHGAYRIGAIAAQAALFFLAAMTKESAVVLPVLLAALDLCFFGGMKAVAGFWRRLYLPLGALAVLFCFFRIGVVPWLISLNFQGMPDRRGIGGLDYFLASLDVIPRYAGLWLAPRPLLADDPSSLKMFPWAGAAAVFWMIVLSVLCAVRFRKQRLVLFSLVLFWAGLAPANSFFPLYLVMDQIRLYLPLLGLSCLMALFISAVSARARISRTLLVALVAALYGGSSLAQNLRYASPKLIWGDMAEKYPDSGIAWEHLAAEYAYDQKYLAAAAAYERAYLVEPACEGYKVNALLAYVHAGIPKKEMLKKLATVDAGKLDVNKTVNLAVAYMELGDVKKGEALLLDDLKRSPGNSAVHLNLAMLWEKRKDLENARRGYQNVLLLAPQNPIARDGIARLGPPSGKPEKMK